MKVQNVIIAFLGLGSVWLGWALLNLAVENDGLKQVSQSHRRSIELLLDYATVATKCDISAEALAYALNANISSTSRGAQKEVRRLAFHASFDDAGIVEVGVVDVSTVTVCRK